MLHAQDLYRHQTILPEESVPIDGNFLATVEQWNKQGASLEAEHLQ